MNKRAIQKAFFVCVFVGLTYAAMAFNVQDRFAMKRTFDVKAQSAAKSMSVAAAKQPVSPAAARTVIATDNSSIEPLLLIAVPVIASSINEGLIEKDGLIIIKKEDGPSTVRLKKPVDILRDKDIEGLKSLSRIIGKKHIEAFLKKEGVRLPDSSLPFDTITGKGFSMNKKVLEALYNKHVREEFGELIPFADGGFVVKKNNGRFEIVSAVKQESDVKAQGETVFTMPDLSGLSMKAALDMIAPRAQKIKIHGSGIVTDQLPKPREQVKSGTQCVLYGRSQR